MGNGGNGDAEGGSEASPQQQAGRDGRGCSTDPPPSQLPIAVAQSRQGVHGGGWERHCGCCSPHPNPCPAPGLKALPVPNCGGLGLSPGVEGVRRGHRHLCAFSPLQSACRRTDHIPEGQDGAGGGHSSITAEVTPGKGAQLHAPPHTRHTAAQLPPTPQGHGGRSETPLSQDKRHRYPNSPLRISTPIRQEATSQHSPHNAGSRPPGPSPPPHPPHSRRRRTGGGGERGAVRSCNV